MRKLAVSAALALVSTVHAADMTTVGGIVFVNLKQFAAENRLTYKSGAAGIELKGTGGKLVLYPYSKAALFNGAKFTLAAPVQIAGQVSSAPLKDLQRVFGLTVTAAPAPNRAPAPSPAPQAAPVVVAPAQPVAPPAPPPYRVAVKTEPAEFDDVFQGSNVIEFENTDPVTTDRVFNLCRADINAGLKSPYSAVYADDTFILVYPDSHWSVGGSVDSQNSYGAMVRSNYYCFMRIVNGNWQIVANSVTRR